MEWNIASAARLFPADSRARIPVVLHFALENALLSQLPRDPERHSVGAFVIEVHGITIRVPLLALQPRIMQQQVRNVESRCELSGHFLIAPIAEKDVLEWSTHGILPHPRDLRVDRFRIVTANVESLRDDDTNSEPLRDQQERS